MSNKSSNDLSSLRNIVYSTNPNHETYSEEEEQIEKIEPSKQNLRVWTEKKQRGGKTACVIKGFVGSDDDLEDLGKKLKTKCGTGGSVKDGEIILQGDIAEKIVKILIEYGYKAKKAGG